MNRPDRSEYYMAIANLASLRSTCLSRHVGAVIVKNDNPISFGYNGPVKGVQHCDEIGGCIRRNMTDYASGKYLEICPAAHAEQNAIAFAAKHGISTVGTTIYVNTFPCKDCMNSIINSGIVKVVYDSMYDSNLSKEIAEEAGIEIVKYEGKDIVELLLEAKFINPEELYKEYYDDLYEEEREKSLKRILKNK